LEDDVNVALKTNPILEQEYATKGELHYAFHLSYARIAQAIREGKVAVHLIDNKLQLRVEDAVRLFFPPRPSLFD
jgi:hypothetical protein